MFIQKLCFLSFTPLGTSNSVLSSAVINSLFVLRYFNTNSQATQNTRQRTRCRTVWSLRAIIHIPAMVSRRQKNGSVIVALFASALRLSCKSCADINWTCCRLDEMTNSWISAALWNGVNSLSSMILNGSAEGPLLKRSVCLPSVALMLPSFELRRKWQHSGTKLHENSHVTTWW